MLFLPPVLDHPKDAPGGCPSCAPGTPVSVLATWMGNDLSFAAPSRFSVIIYVDYHYDHCNYMQLLSKSRFTHTHIYIVHIYCHQTSVFFILIATLGNAIGHFASPCVTLCCSGQGTNPLVQIPFLNCRLVISNSFFWC